MSTCTSTFRATGGILVVALSAALTMLAPVFAGSLQACGSVTDWRSVQGTIRCTGALT